MAEITTLKDPLTGEIFEPKKITQRFANKKNQIAYNNLMAKKKRIEKAVYDKPLDKNRTILKTLLAGKSEVTRSKDFLFGMGYDFNLYHNWFQFNKEKNMWARGIYEYIIITSDNNNYIIKKR
jgi:hypothetical protein